jgi:hypothetical protein
MSVRDLRQTARVVADQVEVTSYVGRSAVTRYRLPVAAWAALERQHPNPVWWKREMVRSLTEGMDEQPGGPEQADRIRDAQLAAIDKALLATEAA